MAVWMQITNDMVLLGLDSLTDEPVQNVEYSAIYRALYTVDVDGNMKFKDSYQ